MFTLNTNMIRDNVVRCEIVLSSYWSMLRWLRPGTHVGSHKFEIGLSKFQLVLYPNGSGVGTDRFSVKLVNCNAKEVKLLSGVNVNAELKKMKLKTLDKMCESLIFSTENIIRDGYDSLRVNVELTIKEPPGNYLPKLEFSHKNCKKINDSKNSELENKIDSILSIVNQRENLKHEDVSKQIIDKLTHLEGKYDRLAHYIPGKFNMLANLEGKIDKLANLEEKFDRLVLCLYGNSNKLSSLEGKFDKLSNVEENLAVAQAEVIAKVDELARDQEFQSKALSSEIVSLGEDLNSTCYDQNKCSKNIRNDVQVNIELLRAAIEKITVVEGSDVVELNGLPAANNRDEINKKLLKLENGIGKNENLIVEVKHRIESYSKLEPLLNDVTDHLNKMYQSKEYDTTEGLRWVWGKVDQDCQTLGKLFEEQVAAQTLVLIDNMRNNQRKSLPGPECPYCMEEMKPPGKIFQCYTGHIICEKCLGSPNIRDCPTCHQTIIGRNRGLESFVESVSSISIRI